MIMYSVKASGFVVFGTSRLSKGELSSSTCKYQRRHYPNEPKRRCSIHNRPTCPFSADDGAETEHRKGPRPVSCKVNSRFRRFGYRTGHPKRLSGHTFDLLFQRLPAADRSRGPTISHRRANYLDLRPSARVSSPWTMTRSFVS